VLAAGWKEIIKEVMARGEHAANFKTVLSDKIKKDIKEGYLLAEHWNPLIKEIIQLPDGCVKIENSQILPMSEHGLYVVHTIGCKGMSPLHTEQKIAERVALYADDGTIGQNFKFYKEMWNKDYESNTDKVEFRVI
jgi:hypothetical protein